MTPQVMTGARSGYPRPMRTVRLASMACALAVIAGCAGPASTPRPASPEDVRAQIVSLLPASVPDRAGWAVDIYAALAALRIEPSVGNVCSVLAITEQESTYRAD